MADSLDKRFIQDDMPHDRLVTYKCAGCEATWEKRLPINENTHQADLPTGLREVSVTIWDSGDTGSKLRVVCVPVCDTPGCAHAGLGTAFELLMSDRKARARQREEKKT